MPAQTRELKTCMDLVDASDSNGSGSLGPVQCIFYVINTIFFRLHYLVYWLSEMNNEILKNVILSSILYTYVLFHQNNATRTNTKSAIFYPSGSLKTINVLNISLNNNELRKKGQDDCPGAIGLPPTPLITLWKFSLEKFPKLYMNKQNSYKVD